MQIQSSKKLFTIQVEFPNGSTREVNVKATSQDQAEQKALKRNPAAVKARLHAG